MATQDHGSGRHGEGGSLLQGGAGDGRKQRRKAVRCFAPPRWKLEPVSVPFSLGSRLAIGAMALSTVAGGSKWTGTG